MSNAKIHAGMRIPLPNDNLNFLSKRYGGLVVKVCNAVLNAKLKDGKFLISDSNLLMELDNLASGSSSTASDLPWQITLQDTPDGRTIQVGDGNAYYLTRPGFNYTSQAQIEAAGVGTNITVPASTTYIIWAEIASDVATVTYGEGADLPADWENYPSTQGIDSFWPGYTSYKGYFLIGFVVADTSSVTISQKLFHNPQIPVGTTEEVIYQGTWVASTKYRRNSIVRYSGATYLRTNVVNGDDGGTPGGGDWTAI